MPGPAFAALAAAINRNIPTDRAAQLLADYRAEVLAESNATSPDTPCATCGHRRDWHDDTAPECSGCSIEDKAPRQVWAHRFTA